MANLTAYGTGTPKASDLLLGTKTATPNTNEENITQNFTVSSVASFTNSYSLGYTVYTAQLNAGAGVVPTVTVLQNTTGLTLTWTRAGSGSFVAAATGSPFIANKCWIVVSAKGSEFPSAYVKGVDSIRVDNILCDTAASVDGITDGFIEIRIYS